MGLNNRDIKIKELSRLDTETLEHSLNVAALSMRLGKAVGLDSDELHELALGALFHDIGKLFIPEKILNKKGKLTDEEMEVMKEHSILGYNYMKENSDLSENSLNVILDNHEKIDGTGYPSGKKGESISKLSKIVSICDVYDALTTDRIYKKAMKKSKAKLLMYEARGKDFDTDLLYAFIAEVVCNK